MATNPASNDIAGAPGAARRLNIGGMPSPPTALLFAALVLVTIVEAASLYTIAVLRDALLQSGVASWLVSAMAGFLILASVLIALPLTRAFLRWRDVRRAVADNNVVAARAARSEAQGRG
ncbi:MAG TPA: hypothetical protein VII48_08505, partial [Rhizomicrobium sp.]